MSHGDQFLGEERDDALGPAIKARRHGFREGCDLSNSHERGDLPNCVMATLTMSRPVGAFVRRGCGQTGTDHFRSPISRRSDVGGCDNPVWLGVVALPRGGDWTRGLLCR